jgi:hypothetical protein
MDLSPWFLGVTILLKAMLDGTHNPMKGAK